MLLGVGALLCGWLGLIPADMNMRTEDGVVSSNVLALWIGGALFLMGILVLAVTRERYAVRIATAEGEKNAVVSNKREYVAQIVDALNRAFSFNSGQTSYTTTTGTTYVDHPDDLRRI